MEIARIVKYSCVEPNIPLIKYQYEDQQISEDNPSNKHAFTNEISNIRNIRVQPKRYLLDMHHFSLNISESFTHISCEK